MSLLLALAVVGVPFLWSVARRVPVENSSPRPPDNRLTGGLGVVLLWVLTGSSPLALVTAVMVLGAGPFRRWASDRRSVRALAQAWPDVLETLAMAIGVGMTVDAALAFVVRCGPTPAQPLFQRAHSDLAAGESRRTVLTRLADESNGAAVSVVDVLISAERDGAPVAFVLDRLAAESSRMHRLVAEERARRAPVLMLAPLTLCSLPAVLIGTIAPFVLLTFGQTSL